MLVYAELYYNFHSKLYARLNPLSLFTLGVILQVLTMMLTAFAIVRERETGTIEQLNITPLRRGELIIGKLIPYIIIAYIQVSMVLATWRLRSTLA